jgi:hypothetical protein
MPSGLTLILLSEFWMTTFDELESLGIVKGELSVYEKFVQRISFDGQRYEVSLPTIARSL